MTPTQRTVPLSPEPETRLAQALALLVYEAQRAGLSRGAVLEAIGHVWTAQEGR